MEKEIRQLEKDDLEAMFKLAVYAFNKEPSVERREHFTRIANRSLNYGLFIDNQLASQVMCTPLEVNFHRTIYQMGGIGYVSSYPEYRGQGGIKEIMHLILEDMKKAGFALSYLAPFSYSFYRKFGYEAVFENLIYELKNVELPSTKKGSGYVKRANLKEVTPILKKLYQKDYHNRRGALVREDWWWEYLLFKNKTRNYAIYYNKQGEEEGYLVYERHETTFKIVEWNYLSAGAFQGIAKFILSHSSAFKDFIYEAPNSEHSLSYLLSEPNGKVTVKPYMMARIVDVENFLGDYPFLKTEKVATFYLGIEDDFAHWNHGLWEISFTKKGYVGLTKVQEEIPTTYKGTPVLKGNIQAWIQLFMGYRRPKDLAFYDKLQGPMEVFNLLEEFIPRGLPTLSDSF